jgi:hypothetical protein
MVEELIKPIRLWRPRGKSISCKLMNHFSFIMMRQLIQTPCTGFSLLKMAALEYWPKGKPPKTHSVEFFRVRVKGIGRRFFRSRQNGLPNVIYTKNSHRGCIKLDHPTDVLTFWKMVAPASIQVGPRMIMVKGCKRMMLDAVDKKTPTCEDLLGPITLYHFQSFLCHLCLFSEFFGCLSRHAVC